MSPSDGPALSLRAPQGVERGQHIRPDQLRGLLGRPVNPVPRVSAEACLTLHSYLGRSCWAVTSQAYRNPSKGHTLP